MKKGKTENLQREKLRDKNKVGGLVQFQTKTFPPKQIIRPSDTSDSKIGSIPFESHLHVRLKHIYGVLYFLKQGFDFPSATHQTLKEFPEVQDYQTISDKCARGFAGSVETFESWFHSGEMLTRLVQKFSLSDHDAKMFEDLLS